MVFNDERELQNFIEFQELFTCEISSGTVIVHTMDLSIGVDVIRYVIPFSANLLSRCPKLRGKELGQYVEDKR